MIVLNDKKYTCPVDVTLGLIGGKWKLLILFHLHYFSKKSYGEFKVNLPGISEKILSPQLKELERGHLIAKTQLSVKPNRGQNSSTLNGESRCPPYHFIPK